MAIKNAMTDLEKMNYDAYAEENNVPSKPNRR